LGGGLGGFCMVGTPPLTLDIPPGLFLGTDTGFDVGVDFPFII